MMATRRCQSAAKLARQLFVGLAVASAEGEIPATAELDAVVVAAELGE
jgi:hypothetical protein